MPTIEFNNKNGGLTGKFEAIKGHLVGEMDKGKAEILVDNMGIIVVIHEGRKLPTVVYPAEDSEGYWVSERVFGEQEVLDEIETTLGEKGVIFERRINVGKNSSK